MRKRMLPSAFSDYQYFHLVTSYTLSLSYFTLFPPALQSAPNRNPQILFAHRPSLSDKCAAGDRQRTCVLIISEIYRSDLPSLVIHESSICEAFRDFAAALKEEQDVCSESETKAYVARKQKELSERLTAKDAFDQ